MKKILMIIILITMKMASAENYKVYTPENYDFNNPQEKTLFILDFSNSMNEYIDGRKKVDLMLETMNKILPKLNRNAAVGLRVYGHRYGITAFDSCRASKLAVPIMCGSAINIKKQLEKTKPRGMTPITYSLKQAIDSDFYGYGGMKHIILLSDGGENCDESPCEYAIKLIKTDKKVKIDVIAFDIKNEDDLSQLECAALVTKGKFYTADNASQLTQSLDNILKIHKEVEAKIIPNQ